MKAAPYHRYSSPDHCTCCGRKLHPERRTYLVMDGTTHTYHATDAEIPADHINQGGFVFGNDCARAVVKRGGVLR